MYQNDELDTDQLEALVDLLGYEFTPEFAAMSEEDKHTKGWDDDEENKELKDLVDKEVEDNFEKMFDEFINNLDESEFKENK